MTQTSPAKRSIAAGSPEDVAFRATLEIIETREGGRLEFGRDTATGQLWALFNFGGAQGEGAAWVEVQPVERIRPAPETLAPWEGPRACDADREPETWRTLLARLDPMEATYAQRVEHRREITSGDAWEITFEREAGRRRAFRPTFARRLALRTGEPGRIISPGLFFHRWRLRRLVNALAPIGDGQVRHEGYMRDRETGQLWWVTNASNRTRAIDNHKDRATPVDEASLRGRGRPIQVAYPL